MKKSLLIILPVLMLMTLSSCEKEGPVCQEGQEDVQFSISLENTGTKATNYTTEFQAERTVNSVHFYVFDSKGRLEAEFDGSKTSAVTKRVSTGSKTVWAIANISASRFSSCRTLSDFESKEVSFADFTTTNYPMSGKKSVTISTGSNTVTVAVERFVSRICIAQVTNMLEGALDSDDLEVTNIFLENVVGNCKVTGAAASSLQWYNQCGRRDSNHSYLISMKSDASYPDFTFDGGSWTTVGWGSTEDFYSCLYMFPNSSTSTVCGWSGTFSPRYTRAVIEVCIRDEYYYYPINIVGAKRNFAYTIYLTITHLGSLDPDTFNWARMQDVSITVGGFDDFDEDFEITY